MSYGDSVKQYLHNSLMSELWKKIRKARLEAELTQDYVAEACGGITRNAVSLWESDDPEKRTRPTLDKLETFSEITNKPMWWFFTDDESPPAGVKGRDSKEEQFIQAVSRLSERELLAALESAKSGFSAKGKLTLSRLLISDVESEL